MEDSLAHAKSKADIDNFAFPDPDAPGRYRDGETAGGYMISPVHIIQNDVSPERVLKFN